jgi:hypothetical protein
MALEGLVRPAPLLQSWAWGEVQSRAGWRVQRLRLPGGAMASVQVRGRGRLSEGYVPRGPVPPTPEAAAALVEWARRSGLAALRLEPEAGVELASELARLGLRPVEPTQPVHTLILELGPQAAMLGRFKPKTRYNIRLAERRGVTVEEGLDASELARQAGATAARQGIRLPRAAYYNLLLEHLPWCRTYVARLDGEPIAAIAVARHSGRAYYLFGGSTGAHRDAMPAYAAHWAAMLAAAAAGCRDYDLWGVPPEPDRSHPWFGLWQFKTGFDGRHVEYAGAFEAVLAPGWTALARAPVRVRHLVRRLGGPYAGRR